MDKKFEEVLEAAYVANESKDNSLTKVKEYCHIDITQNILSKMTELKLIVTNERDVFLTTEGNKTATQLVRRKRLAETLLAGTLNIDGAKMEEIACKFEHAIYPEIEESICILLGHPTNCPHDRPIPAGKCCKVKRTTIEHTIKSLTDMKSGEKGRVAYLKSSNDNTLNQLHRLGIRKGIVLDVSQQFPTIVVRHGDNEIAMDKGIGQDIYIVPHNQ
ncbi:MAG: FeoA domain-containing protein [Bacteriovoracaceae bacterium]|nr:FeoA domain-containing protein [Bacteriovoracaceae bacterium]